jgi:hypothetical protein
MLSVLSVGASTLKYCSFTQIFNDSMCADDSTRYCTNSSLVDTIQESLELVSIESFFGIQCNRWFISGLPYVFVREQPTGCNNQTRQYYNLFVDHVRKWTANQTCTSKEKVIQAVYLPNESESDPCDVAGPFSSVPWWYMWIFLVGLIIICGVFMKCIKCANGKHKRIDQSDNEYAEEEYIVGHDIFDISFILTSLCALIMYMVAFFCMVLPTYKRCQQKLLPYAVGCMVALVVSVAVITLATGKVFDLVKHRKYHQRGHSDDD